MSLAPRAVLVHRRTAYAETVARHGTPGAADFFLRGRGRSLAELAEADEQQRAALAAVAAAVPADWRTGTVERAELPRFLFAPEDVVVVVGQDGLVANAAKHLSGQCVVGIDPAPGRNAGVLVPHRAADAADLLRRSVSGAPRELRTMVRASTDDGQELHALNEVFIGHRSHQTARYVLRCAGRREEQASSGVVVGTGTGATGWLASLARGRAASPPAPTATDPALAWFVREAWPSRTTGADLTSGSLSEDPLTVEVLSDELVVFGDGLEEDRLTLSRGQRLHVDVSPRRLALLR
ncbi:hypothetical protein [Kineococcus sp. SYSU DK001]|uniref:hypothetical protein n=1 Tax=Kineococcus sp. SYSU DK001 TaxID=3383122 RepID=UPI003D7C3D74